MQAYIGIATYFLVSLACLMNCYAADTPKVERWGRYEITLKGPTSGNPYTDIALKATFSNGTDKITVNGFYDGDGIYQIRFMPTKIGMWTYVTSSNSALLKNKHGSVQCIASTGNNHGMVQVWNTYNFKYNDGMIFYPFGTTAYAWTHQSEQLEQMTLNSLKNAPFNKIRMCVFPKYYNYVTNEPELYPYEKISSTKEANASIKFVWNFKKFNPAFFRHLEKRIDDLNALGIQADVIIFHPYDKGHWGFDSMGKANDLFYIKYLTARLSSFRNVWWSMANEFDYIKSKSRDVWDTYSAAVVANDPYRHLCSIHNGSVYFDNWKSYFTHVSIQNGSPVEDFGRAVLLRDVYFKPIIYDEVCYEGNLPLRWGNLTGQQMTEAVWQGIIAGTYVTHGESMRTKGDTIFWAKGGTFKGESPPRIGFLRNIMEQGPGPLKLADPWKDNQTAQTDSTYYLIYFGKQVQKEWRFSLPKKNGPTTGTKFKVDVIDTWNMTVTPINDVFETAEPKDYRIYDTQEKTISLPDKPYMALRLRQIK
ncbi:DUF5060 domain-containing protein [Mucilaginibacter sp.]|uniref:DUF5060 domain-containing protein n=1 Tax=Mucilaginibacter sp. TaxID=1882438 RepID=UPI0031B5EBDB